MNIETVYQIELIHYRDGYKYTLKDENDEEKINHSTNHEWETESLDIARLVLRRLMNGSYRVSEKRDPVFMTSRHTKSAMIGAEYEFYFSRHQMKKSIMSIVKITRTKR